jgi:hypothetical protein
MELEYNNFAPTNAVMDTDNDLPKPLFGKWMEIFMMDESN